MAAKRRLRRLGLALAIACLSPVAAGAQNLNAFEGQWAGEVAEGGEVAPGAFKLEIKQLREGGFAARWTNPRLAGEGPVAEQIDARFGPAGPTGVFALQAPEPTLIERVFARPVTGNPLAGDTLLWGRWAEDALVLYSLAIEDNGHPVLVRSAYRPDGDGLVLERSARFGTEEAREIRVRLVRGGS